MASYFPWAIRCLGFRIPPYQSDFNYDLLDQPRYGTDFRDVKGQEHVKRALEVAAAGGHCVLM